MTPRAFYIACIFTQWLRKDNKAGDVSFLYCSPGKSTQGLKLTSSRTELEGEGEKMRGREEERERKES